MRPKKFVGRLVARDAIAQNEFQRANFQGRDLVVRNIRYHHFVFITTSLT